MTSSTQNRGPQVSRRRSYVEATRQALLDIGLRVFANQPYAEVTGAQLAAEAGVTRGALQHHFGSKQGLYEEVFTQLQTQAVDHIAAAIASGTDPWQQAMAGLTAFLDACLEPRYQMVVLREGPTALGWQHWRELDRHYFDAMITTMLDTLAENGLAELPIPLLAATLRGALTELSLEVASSEHPAATRSDTLAIVDRLVSAFRIGPHQAG